MSPVSKKTVNLVPKKLKRQSVVQVTSLPKQLPKKAKPLAYAISQPQLLYQHLKKFYRRQP